MDVLSDILTEIDEVITAHLEGDSENEDIIIGLSVARHIVSGHLKNAKEINGNGNQKNYGPEKQRPTQMHRMWDDGTAKTGRGKESKM